MGYTEAVLILVLSTSSGETLNTQVVRTFVQDWHCVAFKLDSKYDKHLKGEYEYTNEEAVGEALFFSSGLKCGQCHTAPLFTNQEFLHNGLVTSPADSGRARITYKREDLEKFKVPTLRNIALTAPYMHDGRFQNLEEIIAHYSQGGQPAINKSDLIQGFTLSPFEEKALISFLNCLTDEEMDL